MLKLLAKRADMKSFGDIIGRADQFGVNWRASTCAANASDSGWTEQRHSAYLLSESGQLAIDCAIRPGRDCWIPIVGCEHYRRIHTNNALRRNVKGLTTATSSHVSTHGGWCKATTSWVFALACFDRHISTGYA